MAQSEVCRLTALEPNKLRNLLRLADSDITASLHLVIPFISMTLTMICKKIKINDNRLDITQTALQDTKRKKNFSPITFLDFNSHPQCYRKTHFCQYTNLKFKFSYHLKQRLSTFWYSRTPKSLFYSFAYPLNKVLTLCVPP